MTTMVEEALEACGDKGRMLLLTTPLLEWVCVTDLPADARLAVSGSWRVKYCVECIGLSIVGCTGLNIVGCTGLNIVGCTGLSIVGCTGLSIVWNVLG